MLRKEMIDQLCVLINTHLAQGKEWDLSASPAIGETAGEAEELLNRIVSAYQAAYRPAQFMHHRVWDTDVRFDQCYELLRQTFDRAEIDPEERFREWINDLHENRSPYAQIIIGRFWQTSGLQQYDDQGQLIRFEFDPLVLTNTIASVISGNYMPIEDAQYRGQGIGAIGHLATRKRFQRGQGHGSAMVLAFEQEIQAEAAARGERVRLILLESQKSSQGFWIKCGYRWPLNTRYAQPPLEYDPVTGERFFDEVPETLMVKMIDPADASHISQELLKASVRTMYQGWCLSKIDNFSEAAKRRAAEYVFGKVFAEFVASFPSDGSPIPLSTVIEETR